MTVPTITALPTAPARTDAPATFNTRADAFLGALYSPFATEMNASIAAFNTDFGTVNTNVTLAQNWATKNDAAVSGTDWSSFANASGAAATGSSKAWATTAEDSVVASGEYSSKHYAAKSSASATAAASSATAAATTANAAMWVSGQAYSAGDNAISGVDYKTYRATTGTSGTTDPSSSGDWTQLAYELPSQTGNSGKFLTTNGSAESWGEVAASPQYEAVASGTIANGDTVIVNADGTVSAVTGSGASGSLGADQTFNAATTYYIQGCYDTSNDRLVIAYKTGDTAQIEACVGEISGTTITFGTPTTIGAMHAEWPDIAYNPDVDRVVVVYRKASPSTDYLASVVGEVDPSANTITFGYVYTMVSSTVRYPSIVYASGMSNNMVVSYHLDSGTYDGQAFIGTVTGGGTNEMAAGTPVQINSGRTWYLTRGMFYDPDTNRVVACFTDYNDSENGNAIVIENSTGTTLTTGSEYEFNGDDVEHVAACYDSTTDKGLVVYRDKGDNHYLKARVITIVGGGTNSLTFGTEVTVDSTGTVQHMSCRADATAGKVVVLYRIASGYGYMNTATISGTGATATTTWDGRTTVVDSVSGLEYTDVTYDPDTGKTILLYVDGASASYGTANVYTVPFGSTNLTAENYIGISNGAYADGVTATIQVVGSVDDAQTSLTPGQAYYIGFDGSLALTPIDPSVLAGTAVAATKLLIK